MRKVVFILVLVLLTGSISFVNAQNVNPHDVITLKANGSEIHARITEVGTNHSYFKYKLYDQSASDRVYELRKHEVFKVVFSDGSTWVNPETGGTPPPPPPPPPPLSPSFKKGYIGAGVGVAFLLGDYSDASTGIQFNASAGYLFSPHVGINGSFMLTKFKIDNDEDVNASIGLRGGFVGPLFSFANSNRKIEYDIRPTIGLVGLKIDLESVSVKSEDMVLGFGLGGTIRFNVSDVISLTGAVDYIYHTEFDELDEDYSLASGAVSVGINFRF
jgi:hypothetical protein